MLYLKTFLWFQKHPAVERVSSEGAEIGIQVDLLGSRISPLSGGGGGGESRDEEILRLRAQLGELQAKQKRFARLFKEAPDGSSGTSAPPPAKFSVRTGI